MKSSVLTKFGKEKPSKWPQFLATVTAVLGNLTTGLHTGWPAPALPKLLSSEYPFEVSNEEASYITIISPLENILGGIFGSTIIDRIGRRKAILLIAIPQMISFFLIFMSYQLMELLYVARFIGGLAEGMSFAIIPLYIAEIAEPKIRGVLGTLNSMAFLSGMLFANVVGSYFIIKTSALIFLVFPFIFLVLFWKMPETPYYLLMINQNDEAEKSLKFLRRQASVSEELATLVKDVNRQMSETGTYRDIFTIDSNRKAFFLVIGARIVQQFTGLYAFTFYIQLLLSEATQSLSPPTGASVLLLIQMCMAALSTLFVDRCGSKPLLLFSSIGCFINLLVQAIYFTLKEYTSVDVSVIDWFPLVMMILFLVTVMSGLGVICNILSSEMFSASIKSKTTCLANVVYALSMLATTKFYQITADTLGLSVPFWSFALCTFLGSLFFYFFLPETKGKSLEEIQQVLKGNVIEKIIVVMNNPF